jgi:hypothetical protein
MKQSKIGKGFSPNTYDKRFPVFPWIYHTALSTLVLLLLKRSASYP